LKLNENEYLVFRSQDCSAEGWDGAAFAFVDNMVRMNTAIAPETAAQGDVILEIFAKAADQEMEDVMLARLADAPASEQTRCIVRPVEDGLWPGTLSELAPDDTYMAEIRARDEVMYSCGPYGQDGSVNYFEDRGARVLFHRLGQDQPYWDPASFTFYVRTPDGTFAKAVEE
jgi:hypothetical protein